MNLELVNAAGGRPPREKKARCEKSYEVLADRIRQPQTRLTNPFTQQFTRRFTDGFTIDDAAIQRTPIFEPNGLKFRESDQFKSLSASERNLYEFQPAPYRYEADLRASNGGPVFNVSGVNSSEDLRKMKTIAGEIPEEMSQRQGVTGTYASTGVPKNSELGYIKKGENIRDVLIRDNNIVLGQGLTHQKVASPILTMLEAFEKAGGVLAGRDFNQMPFEFNGRQYTVKLKVTYEGAPTTYLYQGTGYTTGGWGNAPAASGWTGRSPSGLQSSPFKNDQIYNNLEFKITDSETGEVFNGEGLTPHMIHRYGFYQSGPYRLEPQKIIDFFRLKP